MDESLQTKAKQHWQKVGIRHHHGVCLPLSAIRSQDTQGIGDFNALFPLIDWLAFVGMDVLQLLPINETKDKISPYSLHSAFALNPVYLDVSKFCTKSQLKELQALNRLPLVAYKKVRRAKLGVLWKEFKKKKRRFSAPSWLQSYAHWMGRGNKEEEQFHLFLQNACFEEMKKVKKYAEKKKIYLKGDLPILLAPSSIDCKEHPDIFLKTLAVGAPPDSFSANGQNWGFPAYRFEDRLAEIEKWWEERLKIAENFYHLYRIDHAVGFFRLWVFQKNAKQGFFLPKNPKKWRAQGKRLYSHFLKSSQMLPIAEDLGTVPLWVKKELQNLGIPGTKVLRWEKISPKHYPACSMTAVSTHDTETLKQWWLCNPEETKKFCQRVKLPWKKHWDQEIHLKILKLSHTSSSLFHINLLQEYFPLVEGFSWERDELERINYPGKRRKENFAYRFKPYLSDLTNSQDFRNVIREVLS